MAEARELHRCAWCGAVSSSTTGPRARLVPVPLGFLEYAGELERRGRRLLHDEYATTGRRSTWWCRAVKACGRRRGALELTARG
jgi:hypothetical protein